jgi:hypothetical protein
MNSTQSGSEQFMQNLQSLGGSESDVGEAAYVVREEDTVEDVVSSLRIEQQQRGRIPKEPSILHAAAEVMVSRRNERDPAHQADASQEGEYQLDIHLSAGTRTRESIPERDIEDAKIWARERIEAQGAEFGAIYFPAGGEGVPGTGALVSSYDRSVGWYR